MLQLIINILYETISAYGNLPLCNMNPSRGIFINGFCLPLCARCTGIFIGVIFTIFIFLFLIRKIKYKVKIHILFLILAIPCLIDGIMHI